MNRAHRIDLIREAAQELAKREWPEIDLVLRTFKLPWSDSWPDNDRLAYCLEFIEQADDVVLLELAEYLSGQSPEAAMGSAGPWLDGHFRLFLSHLATNRRLVGEVKTALVQYGVDCFVAHDDIEPSQEWQAAIEIALGTCDALAAFLHDGFHTSNWTDQEVGYCLARRVPILPLIFEVTPYGFMARWQGSRCRDQSPEQVTENIFDMLMTDDRSRRKAEEAIITSVIGSRSFAEARDRSARLSRVSAWTQERLGRLATSLDNSQVNDSWHARPLIDRILNDHDAMPTAEDTDDVPF